jgi:hypothetical protein
MMLRIRITVVWDIMPCRFVDMYQRFFSTRIPLTASYSGHGGSRFIRKLVLHVYETTRHRVPEIRDVNQNIRLSCRDSMKR